MAIGAALERSALTSSGRPHDCWCLSPVSREAAAATETSKEPGLVRPEVAAEPKQVPAARSQDLRNAAAWGTVLHWV